MADFVLRATPDMLSEYKQNFEEASLNLRQNLEQIRSLMNKMNASVESPAMTESIGKVEEEIKSCELLAQELDRLSEYASEMIVLYQKAESNFVESVKSRFARTG